MASPAIVVRAYWNRVQARDWESERQPLHDDIIVDKPAGSVSFTGPITEE